MMSAPRPANYRRVGLRALRYFRPHWKFIGAVLLLIVAMSGFGVMFPVLMRQVIDVSLPKGDFVELNLLALAMLGVVLAQGLIGVLVSYLNTLIGHRVMLELRAQMFRHLQQMSIRFFTDTKTGEITSRLQQDVGGLQQVVTQTFSGTLQHLLQAGITIGTMFAIDWKLTLLSLAILPFFLLPTLNAGKVTMRVNKATQMKMGELSSHLQETFSTNGMMLMKTFGRHDYEAKRFDQSNWELIKLQIRQSMIGRWFFTFVFVVQAGGPALIYWYGGHLVIGEAVSLGTVIAFTAFLSRLYVPVGELAKLQVNVIGSLSLFERLFEYLDLPVEIKEKQDALRLADVQGRIVFEDVSFAYEAGRGILKNVSFVIEPGQMTALVGPSGSGKTTLSSLISRLIDPTGGQVLLDGADLRDVALDTLQAEIGVVSQEPYLFHGTILENLRYAKLEASNDEICAAAKAACIHDQIVSLPNGYNTVIGERGQKLSGGEKQRLAIARVLLKQPKILILDEATSALDSESEQMVQTAFEQARKSRTTLVIAHRLSTIQGADQILVLKDGCIVERGCHEELIGQDGLYCRLYQS